MPVINNKPVSVSNQIAKVTFTPLTSILKLIKIQ